jgi:ubiquinone/menaquinone biosynthesis C-methylase UbiE
MNNLNKSILKQYSTSNLYDSIKRALLETNKNPDELTPKDLAPVDFFHIRGIQSTKELAEKSGLSKDARILDIGCGIGGTARFLALQYGCIITGVDIIDEYINTASNLSELLKLNDKTEFKIGSATQLPFEDEMFDIIWTEHVQMNIEDKDKFYSEISRVLKNGGKFVFHDVFKGSIDEVYYPVPWADDSSLSILIESNKTRQLLKSFNFNISYWEDKTEISAEAFQKSVEKIYQNGLPPLGLHLLMGENTIDKIKNMALNLFEKRLTVIQSICLK